VIREGPGNLVVPPRRQNIDWIRPAELLTCEAYYYAGGCTSAGPPHLAAENDGPSWGTGLDPRRQFLPRASLGAIGEPGRVAEIPTPCCRARPEPRFLRSTRVATFIRNRRAGVFPSAVSAPPLAGNTLRSGSAATPWVPVPWLPCRVELCRGLGCEIAVGPRRPESALDEEPTQAQPQWTRRMR